MIIIFFLHYDKTSENKEERTHIQKLEDVEK